MRIPSPLRQAPSKARAEAYTLSCCTMQPNDQDEAPKWGPCAVQTVTRPMAHQLQLRSQLKVALHRLVGRTVHPIRGGFRDGQIKNATLIANITSEEIAQSAGMPSAGMLIVVTDVAWLKPPMSAWLTTCESPSSMLTSPAAIKLRADIAMNPIANQPRAELLMIRPAPNAEVRHRIGTMCNPKREQTDTASNQAGRQIVGCLASPC